MKVYAFKPVLFHTTKQFGNMEQFPNKERNFMKATGIVRRIDDLGRVVIPKEIRRTMRIREGDPLQTSLTQWELFTQAMIAFGKRIGT